MERIAAVLTTNRTVPQTAASLFQRWVSIAVLNMAQIKSLRELADLGFVIAFRFYGRYPETGRSFYHPPSCETGPADAQASSLTGSGNRGRSSSVGRPGLVKATSLILPNLAAQSLPFLSSAGTHQDFGQPSIHPSLSYVLCIINAIDFSVLSSDSEVVAYVTEPELLVELLPFAALSLCRCALIPTTLVGCLRLVPDHH